MSSVVLQVGLRLHQAGPCLLLLLLYSLVVFNLTLIYSVLWESAEIVILTLSGDTIINVSLVLLWWQISSNSSDVFETAVIISAADSIGNRLQGLILRTLNWSWSHLTVSNLSGLWSGTQSSNIPQRDCIELSLAGWRHTSWSSQVVNMSDIALARVLSAQNLRWSVNLTLSWRLDSRQLHLIVVKV